MFLLQITCHGRFFLFQVSEYQEGMFEVSFETPVSSFSLKYIADDGDSPLIVFLWGVNVVLQHQLLINPYQLLAISGENLLMIPDNNFIATLMSPAAKPISLEEVSMGVENVAKILIYSLPELELIAVSTIMGTLK